MESEAYDVEGNNMWFKQGKFPINLQDVLYNCYDSDELNFVHLNLNLKPPCIDLRSK